MKFYRMMALALPLAALGCQTTPVVQPSETSAPVPIEIKVGDHRSTVEAVLGPPEFVGYTKSADLNCMYTIKDKPDGTYKTVVYNRDGKVLEVYR